MPRAVFPLAAMLLREWFCGERLARRAEPTAEMNARSQVEAFHQVGAGPLAPVYHFNASAVSALVPQGGTVVDLGSGSGQYLAYLARCRPDLRIIGIDLAPNMVETGRNFLREEGVASQVELRVGDMTEFAGQLDEPIDLISSVFSLHHLPTVRHLKACLEQVRTVRERCGSGFWVFDHARPRHPRTPEVFPKIFTPEAPEAFQLDSRNSLIASYSYGELREHLEAAGLGCAAHRCSRWMRLYQAHWLAGEAGDDVAPNAGLFQEVPLSVELARDFRGLRSLFADVPLDRGQAS